MLDKTVKAAARATALKAEADLLNKNEKIAQEALQPMQKEQRLELRDQASQLKQNRRVKFDQESELQVNKNNILDNFNISRIEYKLGQCKS